MKPAQLPIEAIEVGERIRKDLGDIEELAESISSLGLIQPIVIDEKKRLVAGGRRFTACKKLGWTHIPVVLTEGSSDTKLRMMELEENVRRKALSWKENVRAIAEVHRLSKRESVLNKDTEKWTIQRTGELLGLSYGKVQYALAIDDLLADEKHKIHTADNLVEAIRMLTEEKEKEALSLMSVFSPLAPAKTTMQVVSTTDLSIDGDEALPTTSSPPPLQVPTNKLQIPLNQFLFKGDCLNILSAWPAECVHHIISDPPYAIDMENLAQNGTSMMQGIDSVAKEHVVNENLDLLASIMPLLYKVLKPGGYCILWTDIMTWQHLYNCGVSAGFKIQRWPLVWMKTHRCKNEQANINWTKATEIAMVLRKGGANLVHPQGLNYWVGANDDLRDDHPFAKPENLWKWLFEAVAMRGQIVLDPFAGSGSSTVTALKCMLQPRAIEVNDDHFNKLVYNFKNHLTQALNDQVEFI